MGKSMIEYAAIISLSVIFINFLFQDGEILGSVGGWLTRVLPEPLHQPVFECAACMTPYYGAAIMLLNNQFDFLTLLAASGMSAVYVTFTASKTNDTDNE